MGYETTARRVGSERVCFVSKAAFTDIVVNRTRSRLSKGGFLIVQTLAAGTDLLVERLCEKFDARTAKIGVVGMGYVGLPFMLEKAKVGFSVIGIDRSEERAAAVNRGESYVSDVKNEELRPLVEKGLIRAVTGFDIVRELDAIVICVPTPLDQNLVPDLQYVRHVAFELAKHLTRGQLISLESTTYPGTTDEVLKPILETSGLACGTDFFLAHSPERVDPGNARYTTKNTNKVVGGVDHRSLQVAEHFYKQTITHVVAVSSAKAAELVKVYENTFRAVNIALANELAQLCDRMDINVWEVLDAAFTKPFGIMPFYPGPGVGGHCIPIDPHYLEWKAREYEFETRFIGLAGETNRHMPAFVVAKAARILNDAGKALRGTRILLLGMAYKNDIEDWRESPALRVAEHLLHAGADVRYHDSYVPQVELSGQTLTSVELESALAQAELTIILTAHRNVDYADVVRRSKHVFDTRNATRGTDASNVTLL